MTSQDDHLRTLDDEGGLVVHDSATEGGLSYSVQTHVDGTPTGKSPYIYTDDGNLDLDLVSLELDGVTPEEAEHVALRILAIVKVAAAARAA